MTLKVAHIFIYLFVCLFVCLQAQRLSLMDHLPAEPGSECTDPVSNLRFRLPDGDTVTRRFLASNPLQVRFVFIV